MSTVAPLLYFVPAGVALLYFVPAGVALLALVWTLVIGAWREPLSPRRPTLFAAVFITLAAAGTGILVSTVIPTFRDPTASVAELHAAVVVWEIGNGARLVLAAAAAASLVRWHCSGAGQGDLRV